jgi:hypothetical protein
MLPSEDRDEIVVDRSGVHGRRVFQYLVTPKSRGRITIAPIELNFFNPQREQFEQSKSQPMNFMAQKAIATLGKSNDEKAALVETRELHNIEGESDLTTIERALVHSQPWYLFTLLLPLLAFLVIEFAVAIHRRRAADSGNIRAKRAHSAGRKRLKVAQSLMKGENLGEFYAELAKTLRSYVDHKHSLNLVGMTNETMRAALTAAGYAIALADRLVAELENCDFARFAPGGSPTQQMDQALKRSMAILSEMEAHRHA